MQYAGETLNSGPCHAASKKTAEQLAAQALLDLIAVREQADEVVQVSSEESLRLQSNNPKGSCSNGVPGTGFRHLHFQQDASPVGYRVAGGCRSRPGRTSSRHGTTLPKLKLERTGRRRRDAAAIVRRARAQPPSPQHAATTRATDAARRRPVETRPWTCTNCVRPGCCSPRAMMFWTRPAPAISRRFPWWVGPRHRKARRFARIVQAYG